MATNETRGLKNNTDYNFPQSWGLFSDEQKCQWFTTERVARRARKQDTPWGRGYDRELEQQERLSTDSFRVDDDLH